MSTLEHPEPSWEEGLRIDQFWSDNYERLLREYPEQFVAVDRGTFAVIATNPDAACLYYDLRDRGLTFRDVAVNLVSDRLHRMIL